MDIFPTSDCYPALADSPTHARYVSGTRIEIIDPPPRDLIIRHCVFDHDGTLSTLRQGWERIMVAVMTQAVFGPRYDSAPEAALFEIRQIIEDYIDRSTGIRTLAQMQWLVHFIRQTGFIPPQRILEAQAYKLQFAGRLQQIVDGRIAKLASGELDNSAFRICDALPFLEALMRAGITLHLVSGTDDIHLKHEAGLLGYAHLFHDRISGATESSDFDAKELIIEQITRDYGIEPHEIAVFGDGPAEMRATRRYGCLCIGVASDEERTCALNFTKRRRLIRAGARLLIPDYREQQPLLALLGVAG